MLYTSDVETLFTSVFGWEKQTALLPSLEHPFLEKAAVESDRCSSNK